VLGYPVKDKEEAEEEAKNAAEWQLVPDSSFNVHKSPIK
jgi:hypothetical protein